MGLMEKGQDGALFPLGYEIKRAAVTGKRSAIRHEMAEPDSLQGGLVSEDEIHVRIVRPRLVEQVDDLAGFLIELQGQVVVPLGNITIKPPLQFLQLPFQASSIDALIVHRPCTFPSAVVLAG